VGKYEQQMSDHYRPLIEEHGDSFRAVDWGSGKGQEVRFQVLSEVADLTNSSVLDVGCGIGHFVDSLAEGGFTADYLGIDFLPEMVEVARRRHPDRCFKVADIVEDGGTCRADYVVGSGLFTFGDRNVFEAIVRAMFAACEKATAFNCLSGWAPDKEPGEFHADPLEVLAFCRTLTPWVSLRHDYFPHDFTLYMYRGNRV
jgi:SAM-dependent methyltransferase